MAGNRIHQTRHTGYPWSTPKRRQLWVRILFLYFPISDCAHKYLMLGRPSNVSSSHLPLQQSTVHPQTPVTYLMRLIGMTKQSKLSRKRGRTRSRLSNTGRQKLWLRKVSQAAIVGFTGKLIKVEAAWDFYTQHKNKVQWDLIALHPPFVIGVSTSEPVSSSCVGLPL